MHRPKLSMEWEHHLEEWKCLEDCGSSRLGSGDSIDEL